MKHEWFKSADDQICRHCAALRVSSTNDEEPCPEMDRRAALAEDRDLDRLDKLATELRTADREAAPDEMNLNLLRRQVMDLVDIVRGDS